MTITWSHVSLSLINSLLDQEIIAFFCKGWNIYTVDIYRERKVATFCKSIADGEIIVKSCFEVVVDWQFTGKEIWDSLAPSKSDIPLTGGSMGDDPNNRPAYKLRKSS